MKLKKHDRVIKIGPPGPNVGLAGTVVGYNLKSIKEGFECYYVLFDGFSLKTKEAYHVDFLQKTHKQTIRAYSWVPFCFGGMKMNIKTENKLKLNTLINHYKKIKNTIYPDSYYAARESILKILSGIIEDRAGLCAADYDKKDVNECQIG